MLDADNYQITLTATANTTGVRQTTLLALLLVQLRTLKTQSATSGSGTGAEFTVFQVPQVILLLL